MLQEMLRTGKSTQTDSRLGVARGWPVAGPLSGGATDEYRVHLGVIEMFPKWTALMIEQLCEYTKYPNSP